jgi:hypothetical protein
MTDIDVDLSGMASLQETIDNLQDDIETTVTWVTGTAVEYAIYLEFGTRDMDPKPFVRPAARVYESNLEAAIAADTNTTLQAIDDADQLVKVVAFGLERRIKKIITAKGLVETGTLRASVRAVPLRQIDSLPEADEIDPDAVATETTREIAQ